jgi:hypothetical protein
MEKKKVYILMEGGVIQYCASDSEEIEVIRIDLDKDSDPSLAKNIVDEVVATDGIDKMINGLWGNELKEQVGREVLVDADGKNVTKTFLGTLIGVSTNTNGKQYATVKDLEGNFFDTDVTFVTLTDEDF